MRPLIFRCESVRIVHVDMVVAYGECLTGPITGGDVATTLLHDLDDEVDVRLDVVAARSTYGSRKLYEVRSGSWGSLTLQGEHATEVRPGDLLASVPAA